MSFRSKMKLALKDMMESLGSKGAVETIRELLEQKKLSADDFSLRELQEAIQEYSREARRAVDSSLFPTIVGEVIHSKVISAYQAANKLENDLVTVVPTAMESEKIYPLPER